MEIQNNIIKYMKDFHQQWMRATEEQARWNMNSIKEQSLYNPKR